MTREIDRAVLKQQNEQLAEFASKINGSFSKHGIDLTPPQSSKQS